MRPNKNTTRIISAIFQALLDVLVYRFSFWIVIELWLAGKIPGTFTSETQIFFAGTMLAVFYFNSLYSFKTWLLWDEMAVVLKSSLLMLLVTVLYLYSQGFDISRFILASGIIIFMPLCVISRWLFRRLLFSLGILSTNIIILGAGRTGKIFAEKISRHPFTLGKITGYLDDDDSKLGMMISGVPVRGKLEDFTSLCESERIDEAAVAISTASRSLLTHILDLVEFNVRQAHYIPDMYMLTTFSSAIRDVDGIPVISASQGLMIPMNRAVKSFTDYLGAVIAIVLLSPMIVLSAFKARKEFGGKIFSKQKRIGLHGKTFTLLKIRSSGRGKTDRMLRQSYIDELPQFFNVLKGEMSLVGPKALTHADMLHIYGAEIAEKISMVKPGITGFWQISERGEYEKAIRGEMNLYYIRNWSLWLDAVIFIKTLFKIFSRKQA